MMGQIAAYIGLVKVRLSALAILAVVAGLCLGSDDIPSWTLVLATIVGTVAVAGGGNALNMYAERDTDPKMDRTQSRPLPSGRLTPAQVKRFGLGTAFGGLAILAVATNLYATAICAVIFVLYVLVYTPMKRRSTLNTLVGAVPGALPPVVGYVAAAGQIDGRAVVLFAILFFWQIPHFLAIAWRYRDDYRRAGMQMLPVVDVRGRMTAIQMIVYCFSLLVVSVLPSTRMLHMTGALYFCTALGLGAIFLLSTTIAAIVRSPSSMFQCFLVSIIYLPLLFSVMVVDKYFQAIS